MIKIIYVRYCSYYDFESQYGQDLKPSMTQGSKKIKKTEVEAAFRPAK